MNSREATDFGAATAGPEGQTLQGRSESAKILASACAKHKILIFSSLVLYRLLANVFCAMNVEFCDCGHRMELTSSEKEYYLIYKLMANIFRCEYMPYHHDDLYTCKISGECRYDSLWMETELSDFMRDHSIKLREIKFSNMFLYGGEVTKVMDFGNDRKIRIPQYMAGFVNPEYTRDYLEDALKNNIFYENVHQEFGLINNFIMGENYSCSICGDEYDSISKEICEEHVKLCIAANVRCEKYV